MAKERSSNTKAGGKTTSPPGQKAKASRLLRELEIDGTAALRGGSVAAKKGTSKKVGGVSYAFVEDNAKNSWILESDEKVSAPDTAAALSRRSARTAAKREKEPAALPRKPGKKRKHDAVEPAAANDDVLENITLAPVSAKKLRSAKAAAISALTSAGKKRELVDSSPLADQDDRGVPIAAPVKRKHGEALSEEINDGDDVEVPAAADVEFLAETIKRAQKVKFPAKSAGHAENPELLSYLQALRALDQNEVRRSAPRAGESQVEAPAAFFLNDKEAKRLFREHQRILAPVFFTQDQMNPFYDEENPKRPLEQALDWLPDDEETHFVPTWEYKHKTEGVLSDFPATVTDIRKRFLDPDPDSQQPLYPWNIPEIVLPTIATEMPEFFNQPNSNLVRDLLRYLQDIVPENICTPSCPGYDATAKQPTAESCDKHLLSTDEVVFLQNTTRMWLGTVMLAEAGAYTHPHVDTFGFGTYICCGEGEIGIAWALDAHGPHQAVSPKNQWVYRVLREGDAVYIDPGRWHLVFRCRGNGQTMAWSTRVLRYRDFVTWLCVIRRELENAANKKGDDPNYVLAWRGLLLSARRLIEQGKQKRAVAKFGSLKNIGNAERALEVAEGRLWELLGLDSVP